jgi:hypothetical protein
LWNNKSAFDTRRNISEDWTVNSLRRKHIKSHKKGINYRNVREIVGQQRNAFVETKNIIVNRNEFLWRMMGLRGGAVG